MYLHEEPVSEYIHVHGAQIVNTLDMSAEYTQVGVYGESLL